MKGWSAIDVTAVGGEAATEMPTDSATDSSPSTTFAPTATSGSLLVEIPEEDAAGAEEIHGANTEGSDVDGTDGGDVVIMESE